MNSWARCARSHSPFLSLAFVRNNDPMKITYTKEILETMGIFARATESDVKDCFEYDGVLYFVVAEGNLGKAVGKGGQTVRELQERLKKRIRVLEFHPNLVDFLRNVIYPLKADAIEENNGTIVLRSADRSTRALLIGRNAKNLNRVKDVANRYFTIQEIKVE